ncbi:UPF0506 protein [Schistosoma japonicum]|nr:UPF0506 protein [Schistosoma japonicum]
MYKSLVILFSIWLIFISDRIVCTPNCANLGEFCTKTVFKRCCDNLVCELNGPFNGKCVECLSLESLCAADYECCSRRCYMFACKPPVD